MEGIKIKTHYRDIVTFDIASIPKIAAIYMLSISDTDYAYIGQAKDLARRIRAHFHL